MFATHVLLTRPALFNAYIAAGPYLAWDDRVVMADLDKKLSALANYEKAVELYSKQAEPNARILGIYKQHAARAAKALKASK